MKSAIRALQITHQTILESMPEERTRERVYAVMSLREIERAIALLAKHEEDRAEEEGAIAAELVVTPLLADTTHGKPIILHPLQISKTAEARERQAEGLASEIWDAEKDPGAQPDVRSVRLDGHDGHWDVVASSERQEDAQDTPGQSSRCATPATNGYTLNQPGPPRMGGSHLNIENH